MIKKTIKSNKLLYSFYQKIRYPKLSNVRDIFANINRVITKNSLNGVFFDGDNSWVRVYDNLEFLYVADKFGGLLGLEKKSGFESIEIDFVSKNLKDGETFIDIGANFGLYSIFVSKKFPNCKVHSFEPLPETSDIFKQNINHNKSVNIKLNNMGLSCKKGKLYFTNDKYAGNHIVMSPKNKNNLTKVEVDTLDDYIYANNIENVDFIKCDVEGAEFLVLQGAKETIKKFHPIILIEIYDEWTQRFGHNAQEVIDYLLDFEYKIKMINHKTKKIEDFDKSKMSEVYDFIFYKNDNLLF